VVAKQTNIWNFTGGLLKQFIHENEVLYGYCTEIGGDPHS